MDQFTRRIIGFGVHAGDVDGVALCRMFNTAISTKGVPKYLSTDNDPLFTYHQWTANLRILDVDELKSIPYTLRCTVTCGKSIAAVCSNSRLQLELQFTMHREIRYYHPGHPSHERAPCCYSIGYDKRSSELGILSPYPRGANTNPKLNRYRCVHD